jgi:hypothetical protein
MAELLARAPKSRSAEHLITAWKYHPAFEQLRLRSADTSIEQAVAVVADHARPLVQRGIAASRLFDLDRSRGRSVRNGLAALLEAYVRLGVPGKLLTAIDIAAGSVRDAITLMVPLIWLALDEGQVPNVLNSELPRSICVDEVPLYALDKHTRVGREAIRNFVKSNFEIRHCLERYVAPNHWNDAAYMAAFYADAAPLARKLVWRGADDLETLGTEADLLRAGVALEGIVPLVDLFRANVPHLNNVRAHTLGKKSGFIDVALALLTENEGSE